MKSIILVLLACVAVINCEVVQDKGLATDFLVDNILNPMLQGINQNALNYLLQQLLGKRSINFQDVTAQIQAALENHKDQIQQALTGIVSTIQNLISTVFPGQKDMGTDFIIDNIVNPMLQAINNNALTFLMQQLLGGLFGKRSINIQDAAAQLHNFLSNNKDQIQQALTGIVSTIQNLISTVFPGQKDMGTDFIIDNIVNPMLQAINNNALTFLMQQLLGGLFGKRDASAKIDLAALINSIVNDLGQNLLQSLIITGGSALETLNNQILGSVATTIEQINSAINQIAAELSG